MSPDYNDSFFPPFPPSWLVLMFSSFLPSVFPITLLVFLVSYWLCCHFLKKKITIKHVNKVGLIHQVSVSLLPQGVMDSPCLGTLGPLPLHWDLLCCLILRPFLSPHSTTTCVPWRHQCELMLGPQRSLPVMHWSIQPQHQHPCLLALSQFSKVQIPS